MPLMPTGEMLKGARCDRCRRRYSKESKARQALWNMTMKGGAVAGFLCPDCQTPAEAAEAVIHESTLNYSTGEDGRVRAKPKG